MINVNNCLKTSILRNNSWNVLYISRCRVQSTASVAQPKSFNEMPGPLKLPIIGNSYLLPIQILKSAFAISKVGKAFDKFGPIFRIKLGQTEIVHTINVDDIEKIYRTEGKYPRRVSVECWKKWREKKGLSKGVLTEEGEKWKKLRKIFDKPMLTKQYLARYVDGFNGVADDFINNIEKATIKQSGPIPNLEDELFHWSIENIGTVLFQIRLGALSDQRSEETEKFIKAVQNVFFCTGKIFHTSENFNMVFLRKWQKLHDHSWDVVFDQATKLIDNRIKDIKTKDCNDGTGYFEYLISTGLSIDEIHGTAAEIMFGAVDTTSVTMQWVLYELSKNPAIQEELYKEITSNPDIKTIDDLTNLSLIKAFLKEILRLYPIALVATRILAEDTELSGYLVPKDTTVIANMYITGRSEDNFKDPNSCIPQRWLRSEEVEHVHSFAWLPFGFGQRSCIGRRLAELEIYILLSKIVRHYVVENVDKEPIPPITTGLLTLGRPLNLRFLKRTK